MSIVVLGGFGFVGKSVMDELRSRNYSPLALSRRNGFDLLDYEKAKRKLAGIKPDVIINCAAHVGSVHYVTQFAADVAHDNLQMISNLYKMLSEVCPKARVINPIANCVYPGMADIFRESDLWNGAVHESVMAYGNTRRMLLILSKCYEIQYKIYSVSLIVPNCYGPGDSTAPSKTHALNGMVIRMLQAKKEGRNEFEIWGTGTPKREWIYVKDVARMLCNAVDFDDSVVYPINIAQNRAYSIRETAEIIKEVIGYEGKFVFNAKYQDGAPIKKLDNELFRSKYPDFTFTDIKVGIEQTVDYYRAIIEKQANC